MLRFVIGNQTLRMHSYFIHVVPFAILISVWSLLTYANLIDRVFLPTPIETLTAFTNLLNVKFVEENLLPSVARVTNAFLLSVLVAFPLGVLSSQFSIIRQLVHPICAFVRYLPVAAFVPLCILWFGIDDEQKIAVIMLGVVFPLVLLIAADTASVPNELIETGRTFGLTWFQIVKRIVLPWSFPAIWDDLRISAGWAWSYLVLAELVAGNRGVGYFIIQSQRYLETAHVFAGILLIGLLGLLTDLLFRISGSRMFRWV